MSLLARLLRRSEPPMPAWYHLDNRFPSRRRLDRAHAPVVRAARRALGRDGRVLDLGCGNGALLRKIAAGRPGVVPYGVDLEPRVVGHARELLAEHADRFAVADLHRLGEPDELFRARLGPPPAFALALVGVRRFVEAEPADRDRLVRWLAAHARRWLVYRYGRSTTPDLATLAAEVGLVLETPRARRASLVRPA